MTTRIFHRARYMKPEELHELPDGIIIKTEVAPDGIHLRISYEILESPVRGEQDSIETEKQSGET